MGERRERPTKRLENSDLVALAKQSLGAPDENPAVLAPQAEGEGSEDDPLADWDDVTPPGVAAGSQSNALPTTSRTATLADPLTTQLLAEVARRTSTMEFDPDELATEDERAAAGAAGGRPKRDTREMDPEVLSRAVRETEAPATASSNIKRRTK